jgi:hypothetical protein
MYISRQRHPNSFVWLFKNTVCNRRTMLTKRNLRRQQTHHRQCAPKAEQWLE